MMVKNLSHELDDNISRRQTIVLNMGHKGFFPQQFLKLIMSFGYNMRGALAKKKELMFLGMVYEKEGKVYARSQAKGK